MKICPDCRASCMDKDMHCFRCGKDVKSLPKGLRCNDCGRELMSFYLYCPTCGEKLN